MVLDAERRGLLEPGGIIVEPTSGNTGIGLAQIAAARGYRLVLTLPSSLSEEREVTLLGYGAELVLTDPERRMLAAIEEAERLRDKLGAWLPNQFTNPANVAIHYSVTAPEVWAQMGGRIDAFVYGSGTGGTISGVGWYLKERDARIRVIAVEPARSPVRRSAPPPGPARPGLPTDGTLAPTPAKLADRCVATGGFSHAQWSCMRTVGKNGLLPRRHGPSRPMSSTEFF